MGLRIENSFELLMQEEWDKYLDVDFFNDMQLEAGTLGESGNVFQGLSQPRMHEILQEHNNKVGALSVTYAFCRHYYDKGIPDDPWYISPGKNGESIQYFPEFKEEHWMRKYWFNYFSDSYYLKISAIWDSVIEIINEYYGYGFTQDLRLRYNVFKRLKSDNQSLHQAFIDIQGNQLYLDAQKYRTAAAHGISAGEVSNTVQVQHDVMTEVPEVVDGKVVMKQTKANMVIALGVGDYTGVKTIMKNMEEYAKLSGANIQDIIKLMG